MMILNIRVLFNCIQARNYSEATEAFASYIFWKKLPEIFEKYIYFLYYKKVTISNILHLKASEMHQINTKISQNF